MILDKLLPLVHTKGNNLSGSENYNGFLNVIELLILQMVFCHKYNVYKHKTTSFPLEVDKCYT